MNEPADPAVITLGEASRFWLRLGLISFGGPAGQIALLYEELVQRRRWLSQRRFLHALNYCMLLPGPEATQLASYLGWLMHGARGALIAGGLFLLPSVVLLLALSAAYALWGRLPLLAAVFWALKPAVLAIVLQAAWRVGRRTLHNPLLMAIAAAALMALTLLKLPYPLIVAAAAVVGWIGGRLWPELFRPVVSDHGKAARHGPEGAEGPAPEAAIHGDTSPTPDHARFQSRRLVQTLLLSGIALGLPLALLSLVGGWQGTLATMARFFLRVALVSFGGAYAVLPYVAQGAVERFGWLSADQMIDGLALGETTPGPLIMVVAFVGFMGGWNGTASLGFALAAGLVVVWFTFLPSFVFILAGAPLVEATREDLQLGAPLTAITAAVVGVIASLAILFSQPVLWPGDQFDPAALAILIAALALLVAMRWSVLRVIGAAALVGIARLAFSSLLG